MYATTIGGRSYSFADLKALLAKASPARSGDELAGVAAERRGAGGGPMALADLPLTTFLERAAHPLRGRRGHPADRRHARRGRVRAGRHLTVGDFRDWLLADEATTAIARARSRRASRRRWRPPSPRSCATRTWCWPRASAASSRAFRNTIGLPGRLSVRLQPNHPTDDPRGIAAAILDGLLYGSGDAVIGINPATDSLPTSITPAARCSTT